MLRYAKDRNKEDILLDSKNEQVMMEWEKPYMEACIDKLQPKGDVLEIGFGMGYSATQIQKYNPKSYTIIECDPIVIKRCKEWAKDYNNVTIVESMWQQVICTNKLSKYDEVFFDDFPNDLQRQTKLQRFTQNNRLYLFLDFLKMHHLKPGSKVSCYICRNKSMYNDEQWNTKIINNPSWSYDEQIMNINISSIQRYHKSNDSAIIPLLKFTG
jgi:guanidinoacetate N-methyltransferase